MTQDRGLTVAAVLLGVAWIAQLAVSAPREVLAAALLPAALWAGPLVLIGVRVGLRPSAIATAFLWGAAVAAPIAGAMNDLGRGQIAALWGSAIADAAAPVVVGPLIEEVLKTVVLVPLLRREEVGGAPVLAGIVKQMMATAPAK